MTDNREIIATAQLKIEKFDDNTWRVKTDYDPPVVDFNGEDGEIDFDEIPDTYIFMGKLVTDVVLPTVASMSLGGDDLLAEETTAPGSASIN